MTLLSQRGRTATRAARVFRRGAVPHNMQLPQTARRVDSTAEPGR